MANLKLEFKPRALKDLRKAPKLDQERILSKIELLASGLEGDVKRLTRFTPEYRLRVGSWRVLFEREQERIVVYRVIRRDKAYS